MKKLLFSKKSIKRQKYTLALIFIAVFGVAGALLIRLSFAAPPNPEGYADFCYLEGGSTVIYGWAHDDDAPAGPNPSVSLLLSTGQTTTVPTDRAGYRDAGINQDIVLRGYTPSSVYGFRAVFNGVYKGSSPTISGTVLNYGPGSNVNLTINDFRIVDGNPNNFPGKKIPDACLASVPVPVSQPPAPAPKPRAIRPTTPRPPSSPAPPATLSTNSDATVTAGTLVASLLIPNGNAEKILISYGTSSETLDKLSDTVAITPDATGVILSKLKPLTTYYYKITRLKNDNTAADSPVGSFKTQAFDVVLSFLNGDKQAAGVDAKIDSLSLSGKSDEKGVLTFKQVPEGIHNLTFNYESKDYQRGITVRPEDVQTEALKDPITAIITSDLQIQEATANSSENTTPAKKGLGVLWIVLIILLVLALLGGLVFWFIRRRYAAEQSDDPSFLPADFPSTAVPPQPQQYIPQAAQSPPPVPLPPSTTPPQAVTPLPITTTSQNNHQPPAPHSGESLKDLVIQSMRAEAARKQAEANQNNPPPSPPTQPR